MVQSVVQTLAGDVRGRLQADVWSFKGVPFGGSTGGAARFGPPSPPEPWVGQRDATRYGSAFPQYPGLFPSASFRGFSEDALELNVWTPGPSSDLLPVLVFVHGGGYSSGAGFELPVYDGTALARRRLVLVSFNYRLGAFGFAHLADLGGERYWASGNAGIADQVAALRWVRDNIEQFGGDPGCVTIIGQSSGGHAVTTLLAVPAAEGLFHRAIAQSGAAIRCRTAVHASEVASVLLDELGADHTEMAGIHEVSTEDLLAAQVRVARTIDLPPAWLCGPVVDGRVLPCPPAEGVEAGRGAGVPLLIGSNGSDDAKNFDRSCDSAVLEFAQRKAAGGQAPVYAYRFSPARSQVLPGADHGQELPYVFDNLAVAGVRPEAAAERARLAARMSEAWIAFARHGDPNHADLPKWPSCTTSQPAVMGFGSDCALLPFGAWPSRAPS